MSNGRDLDGVLHSIVPFDVADRVVDGRIDGLDLPRGVHDVAELFEALRGPATADELRAGPSTIEAFTNTVRSTAASEPIPQGAPPRRRRATSKVVAAVAAFTFLTAGAAAAATGSLPDPVQRTVSNNLAHVGIEVPRPEQPTEVDAGDRDLGQDGTKNRSPKPADATSTTAGDDSGTPVGPDPNGPAKFGLCNAYFASGKPKNTNATSFKNLLQAAADNGETVEEFCRTVNPPQLPPATEASTTTASPTTTEATTTTDAHGNGNGNGKSNGKGPGKNAGESTTSSTTTTTTTGPGSGS